MKRRKRRKRIVVRYIYTEKIDGKKVKIDYRYYDDKICAVCGGKLTEEDYDNDDVIISTKVKKSHSRKIISTYSSHRYCSFDENDARRYNG